MLAPLEYKLRGELQLGKLVERKEYRDRNEPDDRIKEISRRILRPSRITILPYRIKMLVPITLNLSEIFHGRTTGRGIFVQGE